MTADDLGLSCLNVYHISTRQFNIRPIRQGEVLGDVDMPTTTCFSIWLCKCGMGVKAVTEQRGKRESERGSAKQRSQRAVTCPKCGNRRLIECDKVVSVTNEH